MSARFPASDPVQQAQALVSRCRDCRLQLDVDGATQERLESYLALVDRPLTALLDQERLERVAPDTYRYRSNPIRLFHLNLVPTVLVQAGWDHNRLTLRSTECRIAGLAGWQGLLGFQLAAWLQAHPKALEGQARVSLVLRGSLPAWARSLAGRGLDQVLERIERRLERGLRKDLSRWLGGAVLSG